MEANRALYKNIGDQHECTLWKSTSLCMNGAITVALIFQKFRMRLSYTCAHKSGAFALSFGVTFAHIYSQIFFGQLLVFYKVLALLPLFTDLVISLFDLSQGSVTVLYLHVCLSPCLIYGSVLFFYVVMIAPAIKNQRIFKII